MKHEIVTRTHKDFTMSFYPCIECGNEVQPRRQALQCDDCGFWQHRMCGTSIDQATYSLAGTRGRMDWLCVACSLAASNPSEQVPVAESARTHFAQGKEILSPRFVPEIILFWNKNLTFVGQVLSWTFFFRVYDKNAVLFLLADLSPKYPPPINISQSMNTFSGE